MKSASRFDKGNDRFKIEVIKKKVKRIQSTPQRNIITDTNNKINVNLASSKLINKKLSGDNP